MSVFTVFHSQGAGQPIIIERGDKMKVTMQFIDHKGFIRFANANSKAKAIKSLKTLREGTEIYWTSPSEVIVSQQYLKP